MEMLTHRSTDAAVNSGKHALSINTVFLRTCIKNIDIGACVPIEASMEDSLSATSTTDGSWNQHNTPNPVVPHGSSTHDANPDFMPNLSSHGTQAATLTSSATTQTQDPTPNSSASGAMNAPTVVSAGTINEASSDNGSGLSLGAVAGIAIGTLIMGAALASLAAFFLFKRRNKQREGNVSGTGYNSCAGSTPELVIMQQKGVVGGLGGRHSPYIQVSQTPLPAPAPPPVPVQKTAEERVVALLPPVARNGDVQGRTTALFEQIHGHVETYYRDVHASITPSMEPDLAGFGAGDVDMAELLQDCSSPTTALKHALAAYVLGITAPKKERDGATLFPEELSGMRNQGTGSGTCSSYSCRTRSRLNRINFAYRFRSCSSNNPPPPSRRLSLHLLSFSLLPPLPDRRVLHPRSS
jgi:hypothetical protein